MPRKFDKTAWISDKNKGQIQWLAKYLIGKGVVINNFTLEGTLESKIIATINSFPNNEENKLIIQKTKGAWRSYKNRYLIKAKNEVQKSYILPTKAVTQLAKLSIKSNTTINKTLAALINEEYTHLALIARQEKKELIKAKQERKAEKDYNNAKKLLFTSPLRKLQGDNISLKKEVSQLDNQITELHDKYEAQLRLMSEFMVILEDNELLGIPLTKAQDIEAKEYYMDLVQDL